MRANRYLVRQTNKGKGSFVDARSLDTLVQVSLKPRRSNQELAHPT